MSNFIRNKPFWALFGTQFLGAFNDNFFRSAFITLITYHFVIYTAHEKTMFVSAAFGLLTLPFFLFSPIAGQLSDRFNKAIIIRLVKISEIIITGLSAYGFIYHNPYLLLLSLFFMGTHSAFFGPVKYSILPEILPKDKLLAGNGLIEASTFLAIFLGSLFGALLVHLKISMGFLSLTLFLVAALGFGTSCLIPPMTPRAPNLKLRLSWIEEIKRLVRYAKTDNRVFKSIVGISWLWLVGTVLLSQLPTLSKEILKLDESIYIFLSLLVTAGIGTGSILCNKIFKGEITLKFVPTASFIMVVLLLDLATFSSPMAATNFMEFFTSFSGIHLMVSLITITFLGGVYIVPLYTFIQANIVPSKLSQVVALNNIMNAGLIVFGSTTIFLLSSLSFSVSSFFILIAFGQAILTLYLIPMLPEAILRRLFLRVLKIFFRLEIHGVENYKKLPGNLVIIANHTSYIDALLIAVALPEKPLFAINLYTAQKWWVKPFLILAKVFPVDPLSPYSLREVIEEAKAGNRVLIFPEGRMTLTGSLMKIYDGPGLVADKANAHILPIRIEGAQYSLFSHLKRGEAPKKWFPKITVSILPPQEFSVDPEIKGRARRRILSEKLYDIMTQMMFVTNPIDRTLFQSLIESSKLYGYGTKVLEDISLKVLTYRSFLFRVFTLGQVFKKQTIPGETVGIMLPNTNGLVISFWGMQATGRIPALLNYTSGAKPLLNACEVGQIKQIYSSRKFIEKMHMEETIEFLKKHKIKVHYLDSISRKISVIDKLYGLYGMLFPSLAYTYQSTPSDPAVILFTSGSEGMPKGVVLSHKNLQANRYQLGTVVDFNQKDSVFNVLPLFHAFGLTAGMILPLLSGIRTFHYISPLHYRAVAELIYDRSATVLFGTDTFLSGYARIAHAYDFHSLRYVFAGAEKLREETQNTWFEKFGIRIFQGYGATETSPVLCVNTPMHNKAGTVGRFLPAITYKLNPVKDLSKGGRLWVKGPNVMKGYLLSSSIGEIIPPKDGWYDTGDVAILDDEGYLQLLGRAKRFAKIGGEMVSLAAVEDAVRRIWPNNIHAVIAKADHKKGERLILFTDHTSAQKSDLISFWKAEGLSELSLPRELHILSKMPLLGTGKVDYKALDG